MYEVDSSCNTDNSEKVKIIARIVIKLFKKKRQLMREIILLKSAFSIIDQMFHKEIRDGETKRTRTFSNLLFRYTDTYKNPEEMNEFIKNLMDPFNNSVANSDNDFESYYDEYYELYDIKRNDNEHKIKEFKLFSPKTYFTSKSDKIIK